jgi:hypothetical protein
MACYVALVRADVSEVRIASIIKVTTISKLGMLCVSVASYGKHCSYFTDSCHLDDGGVEFLQKVGSYKSRMA